MRFKTIQPDNPILRAEINYQQRVLPRWLQWFDRFGVIVLALGISLAFLCFPIKGDLYGGGLHGGSLIWMRPEMLNTALLILWMTQLLVIFRCLFAGFHTIQHHKEAHQWDTLVLTGITTKQLLIGKLWGGLYQLRGWIVAFGLIKLAVFSLVILNLVVYCYRYPMDRMIEELPFYGGNMQPLERALRNQESMLILLPPLNRIVLTGIHIIVIAILEMMASVAIGIIGGLGHRQMIKISVVIILRFTPIVIFTFLPNYPSIFGITWRWYEYTWFSFADGGSTAILRAGLFFHQSTDMNEIILSILLAFWAAIVMYMAYLLFAFIVSHILIQRQGILSASSK